MHYIIDWLGDKIIDAFMKILFLIDCVVYSIAKISYEVFLNIAKIRLGDGNTIDIVLKRIYIIIGFFMVFILAYNLLTYIIDPDKVSKKGGAGDLIKKIITALVVIVATPTLCNELYSIQNTILESNVIQKLLLSSEKVPVLQVEDNKDNSINVSSFELGANLMIANVYSAFLYPNDNENENDALSNSFDCYTQLSDAYSEENIKNSSAKDEISEYCDNFLTMIETGNIRSMSKYVSDQENYTYLFIVSTIAGCLLVYFFLSFAVGLAGRAAKLLILELIAPIPALIDIVPNQDGRLRAWLKELSSQFLQVFIFEFVVFGAVWMTTLIPSVVGGMLSAPKGISQGNGGVLMTAFTIAFLIFGVLKVAKELPKMICDILGIKNTGLISNNLGSFFGVGAMVGGGTIAAIRGINQGKGLSKISNAIGGFVGGTARGAAQGFNVKNRKDMKNAVKTTYTNIEENRALKAERKKRYGLNEYNGNLSDVGTFFGNRLKMFQGIGGDALADVGNTLAFKGYSNFNEIQKKVDSAKSLDVVKQIEEITDKVKDVKIAKANYENFMSDKNLNNASILQNYLSKQGINMNDNEIIKDFNDNYMNDAELNHYIENTYNDPNKTEAEKRNLIQNVKAEQEELKQKYLEEIGKLGKDQIDIQRGLAVVNDDNPDLMELREEYNKKYMENSSNSLVKDFQKFEAGTNIYAQAKAQHDSLYGKDNNQGTLGEFFSSAEYRAAKQREQVKQERQKEKK